MTGQEFSVWSAEYEIVWTLRRRDEADDGGDFTEIGFGTSGAWESPDMCAHMVMSDVQNDLWETEGDMPDPAEVRREVREAS